MTYEEALAIVEELRGHGRAPFSVEQKQRIEEIYPQIMGRRFRKTSCKRCYHDAVIEMTVKLRRTKKMDSKRKSKYIMRAGFIIRHPQIDNGRIYTNANLTDEVAEKYIELFPAKRVMFDVIPEAVEKTPEERVEAPVEATKEAEQVSGQPEEKTPAKAKKRKKAKK